MFLQQADPDKAAGMKRYMRDQFDYYGLQGPLRKAIMADFFRQNGFPDDAELEQTIRLCWEDPHREMQYFAMELLEKKRKYWQPELTNLLEWMIVTRSWWDTVDTIASRLMGPLVLRFPATVEITEQWIASDNMWLNRAAILFQLKYRDKTDVRRLFSYIIRHAGSSEFFHQKAIGWALRELAKSNPLTVREFVAQHSLKPLSVREALKNI